MRQTDFSIEAVQKLLTQYGINWVNEHKNITRRCIGVCCPFCSDDSFHLGIFKDRGSNFTCWRCGRSGPLFVLTNKLFAIGRQELETALAQPDWSELSALETIHQIFEPTIPSLPPTEQPQRKPVELPPSRPISETNIPRLVSRFLSTRAFSYKDLLYNEVRYCPLGPDRWSQRLLLPIRDYRGALVGAVGRSLTPQEPRYLNLAGASIKGEGVLYGADKWKCGRLILVEGPLDVWRLGDEACASMGASFTSTQCYRVWEMAPEELVIAWDSDAYAAGIRLGGELMPLLRRVKVIRLPSGEDPDSLGWEAVNDLIADTAPL